MTSIRAKQEPVREPPAERPPKQDPVPNEPPRREPPNPTPPDEVPPTPPAEKPPLGEPPPEKGRISVGIIVSLARRGSVMIKRKALLNQPPRRFAAPALTRLDQDAHGCSTGLAG